ncbi:unnamed protein product, partial [Urochloa humidicola]
MVDVCSLQSNGEGKQFFSAKAKDVGNFRYSDRSV